MASVGTHSTHKACTQTFGYLKVKTDECFQSYQNGALKLNVIVLVVSSGLFGTSFKLFLI